MRAKLANYIDMSFFRDGLTYPKFQEKLITYKIKNEIPDGEQVEIVCGQIVGIAFGSEAKTQTKVNDQTGEVTTTESILVIGNFEAVLYDDQGNAKTHKEAAGAYLPKFFATLIANQLKAEPSGATFAIEIGAELTNRNIPTSWTVRSLIDKPAESPLERLKREMAENGTLRIPQSRKAVLESLPAPATIEHDEHVEGETEAGDTARAEEKASKAKHKKREAETV